MLAAGKKLQSDWLDAPGLSRGGSRLCEREDFTGQVLQIATRLFLAASVKHHGASPWHLCASTQSNALTERWAI